MATRIDVVVADTRRRQPALLPDASPLRFRLGEFTADVSYATSPNVEECERGLQAAGVPVPLSHRAAWIETQPAGAHWYVALRDAAGICCCGFAVSVSSSRALPGYRLLRIEDFGPAATPAARDAALVALAELARRQPRILRVNLEVFSADDAIRESLAQQLSTLGFERPAAPRRYARTLALDLGPDETTLLGSFQRKTRQKIRRAEQDSTFVMRPISDVLLAERMAELLRETMNRTGGAYHPEDWESWIAFGNAHPELSHIIGTFRSGARGAEALVAFVWGSNHGDRVDLRTSASTRMADSRTSLTHPLLWELIRWAKRTGVRWFDLGGITAGHHGSGDPLGGISDFKRSFCNHEVTVGEEWMLEPSRLRGRVAHVVGLTAAWLSRARDQARIRQPIARVARVVGLTAAWLSRARDRARTRQPIEGVRQR